MQERILAVTGKVVDFRPIEGADRIIQAEVICGKAGRWTGVVPLGMRVGQKVIVFLQDAVLPQDPRWAFMEARNWRISMARFKGAPSECLIMAGQEAEDSEIGTNLTELLGVTKYEKPVPGSMAGEAVGSFPSFIPKTDETNFQASEDVCRMAEDAYYITEKADGTSCTIWVDEDCELHVCSRNLELREFSHSGKSNVYWRAARKYEMEALPVGVGLQFEVVGPGIQSNRMGLTETEVRVFRAWDIEERRYWEYPRLKALCQRLSLPLAKCLGEFEPASVVPSSDELREMAEIQYANGKTGEGIVIQSMNTDWSFKVINLLYKD